MVSSFDRDENGLSQPLLVYGRNISRIRKDHTCRPDTISILIGPIMPTWRTNC